MLAAPALAVRGAVEHRGGDVPDCFGKGERDPTLPGLDAAHERDIAQARQLFEYVESVSAGDRLELGQLTGPANTPIRTNSSRAGGSSDSSVHSTVERSDR